MFDARLASSFALLPVSWLAAGLAPRCVAGWMLDNKVVGSDKILYTTGRLTSEMVIKTAVMGIPILLSRSGFTAWGVELAESVGLTMIGRLRGHRFICLTGADNIIFDEK